MTAPTTDPPGDVAAAGAAPPEDRAAEFARTLTRLTPRAFVTPTFVALNVLVFAAMAASGVNVFDPTAADLIRWGADYGPKTGNGQWWRLLTAAFVHAGLLHLLFNMWALLGAGVMVERLAGNVGFALLYLVSALAGSVASVCWHPQLVCVGASGAVFGVYGALLGFLLRCRGAVPAEALAPLRNSGAAFLVYNLAFGVLHPQVDVAAHVGGLAAGFLAGLALGQAPVPEARAGRPARNLAVGAAGFLLLLVAMVGVPPGGDDVPAVLDPLRTGGGEGPGRPQRPGGAGPAGRGVRPGRRRRDRARHPAGVEGRHGAGPGPPGREPRAAAGRRRPGRLRRGPPGGVGGPGGGAPHRRRPKAGGVAAEVGRRRAPGRRTQGPLRDPAWRPMTNVEWRKQDENLISNDEGVAARRRFVTRSLSFVTRH
jgi:rhomboid protease GluP